MNTNMENTHADSIKEAITESLLKLKKEPEKDGVDLVDIAKKLSEKKFGKKR